MGRPSTTWCTCAALPRARCSASGNHQLSGLAQRYLGALGPWAYYVANIFALLAMLTSYWGLGGCLFTNIFDHFRLGSEQQRLRRVGVLCAVSLPPFVLAYSGVGSFVDALYFAGTFGDVLMASSRSCC